MCLPDPVHMTCNPTITRPGWSVTAGSSMTIEVRDSSSEEVSRLAPEVLVNAAGLQAQEVAGKLKGLPAQHVPKRHLARGCYFSLSGMARMLPAVKS
jgi:glycerol-3-phosphate dehydrogenase